MEPWTDNRIDPVEIIARVGEQDGSERAFGVWVHKAQKAGWTVTIESMSIDQPGTQCGTVEVEGLRYRIHHGERVRKRVGIIQPGRHVIAAAMDVASGNDDDILWTWEFDYAAWAEPCIEITG